MQPASRRPFRDDPHHSGTNLGAQVVEDPIGDGLVENSGVAERLEIQFVTLELEAELVGRIDHRDRAEIGLAGHGAYGCKFRCHMLDFIIPVGIRVWERLNRGVGVGLGQWWGSHKIHQKELRISSG